MSTPTITKPQLNDAVRALAKKDRPAVVAILARHDVMNTAELPPEHWQAVHDACVKQMARVKP